MEIAVLILRFVSAYMVTVIFTTTIFLLGVYVIPSRMRRIGSWILVSAVCITYCLFWLFEVRPYGDPENPVLPMLPGIALAGTAAALFFQFRKPSKSEIRETFQ